jgi:hypothetical protein
MPKSAIAQESRDGSVNKQRKHEPGQDGQGSKIAAIQEIHVHVFRLSNAENELPDSGEQTTWIVT